MFKDRYKKALNNMHPDKEVKEKIQEFLDQDEQKVIKVSFPYKRVIAAVATVAIVIGAVYLGTKRPTTPIVTESEISSTQSETGSKQPEAEKTPGGYKKLYNALNDIKERYEYKQYNNDMETGVLIDEVQDDVANDVALEGGGALVQSVPSAAAGENGGSATQQNDIALEYKGNSTHQSDSADKGKDYSGTNVQIEGVDEADVVKTDGKYIYVCKNKYNRILSNKEFKIVNSIEVYKAAGANTKKIKSIRLKDFSEHRFPVVNEMYVNGNRLVAITETMLNGTNINAVQYTVYDTSTEDFKRIGYGIQEGIYCSSRMQGGKLFIVTNRRTRLNDINGDDKSTYVPSCIVMGRKRYIASDSIYVPKEPDDYNLLIVGAYSTKDASQISSAAVLGGGNTVYMDSENMIVSDYCYPRYDKKNKYDYTELLLFSVKDGKIKYKYSGKVKGTLLNQFSMDVYNGYLRVCTTVHEKRVSEINKGTYSYSYFDPTTTNSLYVLSIDGMRRVGAIENLAEDERIYSARFTGDIGYFVTFRETDPLFAVDLKNPKKPKILSALKIDGFSSYLHPFGEGKLLGFGYNTVDGITTSLKLTMFDTSDPTDVSEIVTETVSNGEAHSPATDNHKAIFVDVEKNMFGFMVENYERNQREYRIYKYEMDNFNLVAKLSFPNETSMHSVRGLYIDDTFYVCASDYVKFYEMPSFKLLGEIVEEPEY